MLNLLLLALLRASTAVSQSFHFTYPPPSAGVNGANYDQNVILYEYTLVNVTWDTTIPSYSIWLWQQSLSEDTAQIVTEYYSHASQTAEVGYFPWTVTSGNASLDLSNVFFFSMAVDSETIDVTSQYFNMSDAPLPASTSSSTSSSVTTTSSSANTVATSQPQTTGSLTSIPSPTYTASSKPSGYSPTVGLGLGLGIGIPVVLILAGILAFLIWRHKKAHGKGDGDSGVGLTAYPEQHETKTKPPSYSQSRSYELSGSGRPRSSMPAELGNSR